MQLAPNLSALRTPAQATTGWGARQRKSPTGGAAYGMPLKTVIGETLPGTPWTEPPLTLTGPVICAVEICEQTAANRKTFVACGKKLFHFIGSLPFIFKKFKSAIGLSKPSADRFSTGNFYNLAQTEFPEDAPSYNCPPPEQMNKGSLQSMLKAALSFQSTAQDQAIKAGLRWAHTEQDRSVRCIRRADG